MTDAETIAHLKKTIAGLEIKVARQAVSLNRKEATKRRAKATKRALKHPYGEPMSVHCAQALTELGGTATTQQVKERVAQLVAEHVQGSARINAGLTQLKRLGIAKGVKGTWTLV